jgi:hypothetical protein
MKNHIFILIKSSQSSCGYTHSRSPPGATVYPQAAKGSHRPALIGCALVHGVIVHPQAVGCIAVSRAPCLCIQSVIRTGRTLYSLTRRSSVLAVGGWRLPGGSHRHQQNTAVVVTQSDAHSARSPPCRRDWSCWLSKSHPFWWRPGALRASPSRGWVASGIVFGPGTRVVSPVSQEGDDG